MADIPSQVVLWRRSDRSAESLAAKRIYKGALRRMWSVRRSCRANG